MIYTNRSTIIGGPYKVTGGRYIPRDPKTGRFISMLQFHYMSTQGLQIKQPTINRINGQESKD